MARLAASRCLELLVGGALRYIRAAEWGKTLVGVVAWRLGLDQHSRSSWGSRGRSILAGLEVPPPRWFNLDQGHIAVRTVTDTGKSIGYLEMSRISAKSPDHERESPRTPEKGHWIPGYRARVCM